MDVIDDVDPQVCESVIQILDILPDLAVHHRIGRGAEVHEGYESLEVSGKDREEHELVVVLDLFPVLFDLSLPVPAVHIGEFDHLSPLRDVQQRRVAGTHDGTSGAGNEFPVDTEHVIAALGPGGVVRDHFVGNAALVETVGHPHRVVIESSAEVLFRGDRRVELDHFPSASRIDYFGIFHFFRIEFHFTILLVYAIHTSDQAEKQISAYNHYLIIFFLTKFVNNNRPVFV